MTLFLTSSPAAFAPSDGGNFAAPISEKNGLQERLRAAWPHEPARVLSIASDPNNDMMNSMMTNMFVSMFSLSGLDVEELNVIDRKTEDKLDEWLHSCDVVILNGGHVPTQNRFFAKLGLREKMKDFGGIVIGVSAGTMNSSEVVYAQPELEGESTDPDFERFLPGLGLTKTILIPHYEAIKDDILDGKRLFEDITYPDSFGHVFYALEDGSYLYGKDGKETICGRTWVIKDGEVSCVCEDDETLELPREE